VRKKITELIDQLREKMETGGWKVEMKSKFQTLSSCAEYVKHLIKVTEEKEKAVQKARLDLQMKERKVEEEKALQEPRSDPESVMSSLTSSTGGSVHALKIDKEDDFEYGERKRKTDHTSVDDHDHGRKKQCLDLTNNSIGSSESSREERTSSMPGVKVLEVKTESDNMDSSKVTRNGQTSDDEESSYFSNRSSDGTVTEEHGTMNRKSQQSDVVIQSRSAERKQRDTAVTSLDATFELDYEEVFTRSNVPQVIATTAGKIVRWNDFFLKATGVSKAEVKKITLFSLVKADKLSNLFEIVAAALKKGGMNEPPQLEENSASDGSTARKSRSHCDYAGMTLPCIDFRAPKRQAELTQKKLNPMYITVTLMGDDDPSKRLFHCMFTDCPGTNGALGSITPELLALHFMQGRKESAETRK